jgi:hypothetical protein
MTTVNNKLLYAGVLKLSHPYAKVVATQFMIDWSAKY